MTSTIYANCTFVYYDEWCMLPRYSLLMGFIASVTEFHGWGKGGEGVIDDNEMF